MHVVVLDTAVDHRSRSYREARAVMLAALESLEAAHDQAREGGGERAVTRHHARGRLLPRERMELLVDRDSPLLELSPAAGWGTGVPVGAALVSALGVVAGRPCVLVADDPTLPAGAAGGATGRKLLRALQIALENRLPLVVLAETGEPGPAPEDPPQAFHQTGQVAAGLARLTGAGLPTLAVHFGAPWVGLRDAGRFDHTIAVRDRYPLPAADQLAEDERDALRLARRCASRFPAAGRPDPPGPAAAPKYDPEDLLGLAGGEPREILARLLDGSDFDEIGYAAAARAGWGEVHGHPLAVFAETGEGAADPAGVAGLAARTVRLAARAGTPVLFLRRGAGPALPEALALAAAAGVPMLSLRVGQWCGVAELSPLARFRFAWPGASAGLPTGPAGAGVTAGARATGGAHRSGGDSGHHDAGEGDPDDPARGPGGQMCSALELTGRLDDDGVIDPRDTRTVVGLCLSVMAP